MGRSLLHRLSRRLRPFLVVGALGLCTPIVAVAVSGCSTPSVPLPPPSVDLSALTFTTTSAGQISVVGLPRSSHARAVFYVLDQKSGDGVIATAAADGSFTTPPFGFAVGGVAEIFFVQPDGVRSESTCVTVELSTPLFGATCQ